MRELHKEQPTAGTKQFLERCFRCCSEESRVLTGRAVARLAQARYPAQILIFFKLKMANLAIFFLGIPRQGQVVILRPAGLQIFPKKDALGLTKKWAVSKNTRKWVLRNNKRDVIIKTVQ